MNILEDLEVKYENFTFGRNRDNEVFVNGQNTHIKLTDLETVEKELFKGKFIKK